MKLTFEQEQVTKNQELKDTVEKLNSGARGRDRGRGQGRGRGQQGRGQDRVQGQGQGQIGLSSSPRDGDHRRRSLRLQRSLRIGSSSHEKQDRRSGSRSVPASSLRSDSSSGSSSSSSSLNTEDSSNSERREEAHSNKGPGRINQGCSSSSPLVDSRPNSESFCASVVIEVVDGSQQH